MFAHRGDTLVSPYTIYIIHRLCQVNTALYLSIFVATVPLQRRMTWRMFPCGLRFVCEWFAARVVRLRVARRRASSENKSAKGPLSAYAQDLNQPPPVVAQVPLYISRVKGASVFEFVWIPWCPLLVCAVGVCCVFFWAWWRKNFYYFSGLRVCR